MNVWKQWQDWPAHGDVSEAGFCRVCRSYFCPHAHPSIYVPEWQQLIRNLQRRVYSGKWQ